MSSAITHLDQAPARLLVVDFDFFFPNPLDAGATDTEALRLYDWGHAETMVHRERIWPVRAGAFAAEGVPLPRCEPTAGFWDRFTFDTDLLLVADSNAYAGPLAWEGGFDEVVVFDATTTAATGAATPTTSPPASSPARTGPTRTTRPVPASTCGTPGGATSGSGWSRRPGSRSPDAPTTVPRCPGCSAPCSPAAPAAGYRPGATTSGNSSSTRSPARWPASTLTCGPAGATPAPDSKCSSTATRPSPIRGVSSQPNASWTFTARTGASGSL